MAKPFALTPKAKRMRLNLISMSCLWWTITLSNGPMAEARDLAQNLIILNDLSHRDNNNDVPDVVAVPPPPANSQERVPTQMHGKLYRQSSSARLQLRGSIVTSSVLKSSTKNSATSSSTGQKRTPVLRASMPSSTSSARASILTSSTAASSKKTVLEVLPEEALAPLNSPLEVVEDDDDDEAIFNPAAPPQFELVVAGFPKTGTTTLLRTLSQHPEVDIAPIEFCILASPGLADTVVRHKMNGLARSLSSSPQSVSSSTTAGQKQRAFKCPTTLYNYKSLIRLQKHSPHAKLIVGLRHPVRMLESYYNYRVTEIYDKNLSEEIPSLLQVVSQKRPWKGVSLEATRFELFLMQLGKTRATQTELEAMVGRQYDLAIKPTDFSIFLYTLDQLADSNTDTDDLSDDTQLHDDDDREAAISRSQTFAQELRHFLGLSTPLAPFGIENKNHYVGKHGYRESINICDIQFDALRQILIDQGRVTAAWIRDTFLRSREVTVANREHFLASLESWGVDPCLGAVA